MFSKKCGYRQLSIDKTQKLYSQKKNPTKCLIFLWTFLPQIFKTNNFLLINIYANFFLTQNSNDEKIYAKRTEILNNIFFAC